MSFISFREVKTSIENAMLIGCATQYYCQICCDIAGVEEEKAKKISIWASRFCSIVFIGIKAAILVTKAQHAKQIGISTDTFQIDDGIRKLTLLVFPQLGNFESAPMSIKATSIFFLEAVSHFAIFTMQTGFSGFAIENLTQRVCILLNAKEEVKKIAILANRFFWALIQSVLLKNLTLNFLSGVSIGELRFRKLMISMFPHLSPAAFSEGNREKIGFTSIKKMLKILSNIGMTLTAEAAIAEYEIPLIFSLVKLLGRLNKEDQELLDKEGLICWFIPWIEVLILESYFYSKHKMAMKMEFKRKMISLFPNLKTDHL